LTPCREKQKKKKEKDMFTVKLVRCHVTKIIQAEEVNIYPSGPFSAMADDPGERTNDVREVYTSLGAKSFVFYVVKNAERPPWMHNDFQVFDSAYVENDAGATTEVVRPY
jgi:hypothetical protein